MADENIRKRDPAENRKERMGYREDSAKTGGDERNVGLTNAAVGRTGAGSGGAIGGSEDFLSGDPDDEGPQSTRAAHGTRAAQTEGIQVPRLAESHSDDTNFGGRTGSGTSNMARNSGRSDLGSAGVGEPAPEEEETEDQQG